MVLVGLNFSSIYRPHIEFIHVLDVDWLGFDFCIVDGFATEFGLNQNFSAETEPLRDKLRQWVDFFCQADVLSNLAQLLFLVYN